MTTVVLTETSGSTASSSSRTELFALLRARLLFLPPPSWSFAARFVVVCVLTGKAAIQGLIKSFGDRPSLCRYRTSQSGLGRYQSGCDCGADRHAAAHARVHVRMVVRRRRANACKKINKYNSATVSQVEWWDYRILPYTLTRIEGGQSAGHRVLTRVQGGQHGGRVGRCSSCSLHQL